MSVCERCGGENSEAVELMRVRLKPQSEKAVSMCWECIRLIVSEWLIRRGDVDLLKQAQS